MENFNNKTIKLSLDKNDIVKIINHLNHNDDIDKNRLTNADLTFIIFNNIDSIINFDKTINKEISNIKSNDSALFINNNYKPKINIVNKNQDKNNINIKSIIFLLPKEIDLLPKTKFPSDNNIIKFLNNFTSNTNIIKFTNRSINYLNRSINDIFKGSINDCINKIKESGNNYKNILFCIELDKYSSENFNFYESYYIPISYIINDKIYIHLLVNDINVLIIYNYLKIKDIVMFDICKY